MVRVCSLSIPRDIDCTTVDWLVGFAVSLSAVLSGFKRSDASSSEGEPCSPCPWRTQHARALARLLCPEVTSGEPCGPVDGARAGRRPPTPRLLDFRPGV